MLIYVVVMITLFNFKCEIQRFSCWKLSAVSLLTGWCRKFQETIAFTSPKEKNDVAISGDAMCYIIVMSLFVGAV